MTMQKLIAEAAMRSTALELEFLQGENFRKQNNFYNYGVFLLLFLELFLANPS